VSKALALLSIRTDGGTQSRDSLNEQTVQEYAEAMREGAQFPPIVVFHDGSKHWLADGFHRFMAARKADLAELDAVVHQGTRRDAVLYSVGANAAHGLPRTNADKRLAVTMLLQDDEWAAWSDREIARRCAVSPSFVGKTRESILSTVDSMPPARTFTHHRTGTEATMRTENIGRRRDEPRADHVERESVLPHVATPRPVAKSRGIGLGYAHQAIACLQKIPSDDGLRNEALDEVVRWIRHNR
jgi:hypothetical protein